MSNPKSGVPGGVEGAEAAEAERVTALEEIAESERQRASAYTRLEPGKPADFEHPKKYRWGDITAAVSYFLRNKDSPNTTLTSFEMDGNWEGAEGAEREVVDALELLRMSGYRIRLIPRDSPEADATLRILTDQTSASDWVALHRLRTLAKATYIGDDMDAEDPRRVIVVRKGSVIGANMAAARVESPHAAMETDLIVVCSKLRVCRLDLPEIESMFDAGMMSVTLLESFLIPDATANDRARLDSAVRRIVSSGIPDDIVFGRLLKTGNMTNLHSELSIQGYENGITSRSGFLAPAANTYYMAGTRPTQPVAHL